MERTIEDIKKCQRKGKIQLQGMWQKLLNMVKKTKQLQKWSKFDH